MRWLRRLGALSLVAIFLLLVTVWWLLQRPIPGDPVELAASGLEAPVQIRYDGRRRPFVTAVSFTDAVYTQGWLHARERFWQMELLRRAGKGRLAELLGRGLLATDEELHRAGVPALAEQMAANADAATLAVVDAYLAGINLALVDLVPPVEFMLLGADLTPWTRADVFAIGGVMAFQSGRNMRNELLRLNLMTDLTPELASLFLAQGSDLPVSVPERIPFDRYLALEAALGSEQPFYQPPLLGSNGWVVGPSRSATGQGLFAFDSHDGWGMPSLFYEVHLFFPGPSGPESVRGFSVPGLPGAINGFNEFMAWGFTNIGDSQDLYLETRDPENPLRFKGREGWYEAEVTTVAIPVAGAEDHELAIVRTENGPLIQTSPPISLRWSAAEIGTEYGLDALFLLNRATSLEAFMAAIDRFPAPSANVTYADVAGNIVFRTLGLLPERGSGSGLAPLPADDPASAWRGLLPLTGLPRSVNPETGYLVKANARVLPEPPLISADNAPGYRQARLETLLAAERAVDFKKMSAWQGDWYNLQAEWLLPEMLDALRGSEFESHQVAVTLEYWSTRPLNEPELAAPLYFNEWYLALARRLFAERLGEDRFQALLGNSYVLNHALDRLIVLAPDSPWWGGARRDLIRSAFADVLAAADRREPPRGQVWGDVHQLLFKHEMSGAVPGLDLLFDRGPFAWGGGNPTVGRARFRYNRPYTATGGATVRLVLELSQPMRIGAIMPGGQSGHALSAHYDDQLPVWMDRTLDVIPATPQEAGDVVTTLLP
ncbi:MAG: penicillin acylase family protein [Pseudomonadota bacterium]